MNRRRVDDNTLVLTAKAFQNLTELLRSQQLEWIRRNRPSGHNINIQTFNSLNRILNRIRVGYCVRKTRLTRLKTQLFGHGRTTHISVNQQHFLHLTKRFRDVTGRCGLTLARHRGSDKNDLSRIFQTSQSNTGTQRPHRLRKTCLGFIRKCGCSGFFCLLLRLLSCNSYERKYSKHRGFKFSIHIISIFHSSVQIIAQDHYANTQSKACSKGKQDNHFSVWPRWCDR